MSLLPRPVRRTSNGAAVALVLAAFLALGTRVGGPSASQAPEGAMMCYAAQCIERTIGVGPNPVALAIDTQTRRAFVRNGDSTVSVLDLTRDTILRTVAASKPDADVQGLAVDEWTGRVFVTSGSAISVLDATSGALLHTVGGLGAFPVDIAVDERNNRVFVPTGFGTVSMLDARTGAVLHTVHAGGTPVVPPAVVVDERTGRVFVAATSFVKVLDATSDALLRTVGGVSGGIAYIALDEAAGRVFVADFTGGGYVPNFKAGHGYVKVQGVSVLDARDGTLLRSLGAQQGFENTSVSSLVVDEPAGRVFVVGGSVSVLDARSGAVLSDRILQRYGPGGGAGTAAVDAQNGRLFVPIAYEEPATNPWSGTVTVLDVATARVLTTIPLGGRVVSVTVDAATGQALVLNQNDPTHPTSMHGSVSVLNAAAGNPQAPLHTPAAPAALRPGARYFPQTHHNLSDAFLAFWRRYGGVAPFGYPRTEPFTESARLAQYTGRFLLEQVHGQVQTAPLGLLLTLGRTITPEAPPPATSHRLYFPATRHSLSGRFLKYWRTHHGALLLGAPISQVIGEENGDGSGRCRGRARATY